MGLVVGVDLGTTYSSVGVFLNNKVQIIANEQGECAIPSWVAFTDDGRLIGRSAKVQGMLNLKNTVYNIKRVIGRKWGDEKLRGDEKYFPFTIVFEDGRPSVEVVEKGETKKYSPEEISAMILGEMKRFAEEYLKKNVTNAVVTCPANFNDRQRQATKDAGEICGLNVVKILNEPVAAAIAFGINRKYQTEKNILVYDLGGGTFDVSLVQLDKGLFEVLAGDGDDHLGGEDFDQNVMDYFIKKWKKDKGADIRRDKRAVQKLRLEVEKAKCTLSEFQQVVIEIENFFNGVDFEETLTRARFNELNLPLFRKTIVYVERLLEDTHLKRKEIDEIVMVGGSSRIPKVRELVQEFFNGKKLASGVDPDMAVAWGAAIQASLLSDEEDNSIHEDVIIIDRTPLSIGIETAGGIMTPIVERNTIIPCKREMTFHTRDEYQTSVHIRVYQGERSAAKNNHRLDDFRLSGFPPARRSEIVVTMEIDANNIMSVTAVETTSGVKKTVVVTGDRSRLSDDDIRRMREDAEQHRAADEMLRKTVSKRNELEGQALNMDEALTKEVALVLTEMDAYDVREAAKDTLLFLEKHSSATLDEYEDQLKRFQEIVNPILEKFYKKKASMGKNEDL